MFASDTSLGHSGKTDSGRTVALTFPENEYRRRLQRTGQKLCDSGLAALLVFAQESHLYLTGFDTAGYVFFQCGIITPDGKAVALLTRRPDQSQALRASLYENVHIWYNANDADPAADLAAILKELGLEGKRLGVELATYGLTGFNWESVRKTLGSHFTLEDGSAIVREQRLIKSEAELGLVRRSAQLADDAVEAMIRSVQPGVLDSSITAAGVTAMLNGGGDMPAAGPMVNTGPRAIYGRGFGSARHLENVDQIVLELAASYRRYNVCTEHTVTIGAVPPKQKHMHAATVEALEKVLQAARPGEPIGRLDDIHRSTLDHFGYERARFSACGYSLGATFRPSWMDAPPMIYSGNPILLEPGMVLFVHIMLGDAESGLAAGVGETFVIRDGEPERLSRIRPALHRI
ncbi:MAG: Xaa-Pro peptidase family protein [Gluconobacter potus]|uniref:Aminopeptidase P family protein n=1 Tax=Gluconobacter potus TaxID=2724927 RepID=A0ABR9YPZ0_9PROT|nr:MULTISPECIES: Xaa-Pro peptidase family protein [Gluconobacter]MBF0865837.1 aminopeptidase P family protein [Gluconobacter sp. R71656]MBF0868951.1 aminopeptidase P family protein [Gluconobacter sp. R75628]MBF0874935.1 aminopeptidase P family protein [Gluconobacter sp. R75629]MBF0883864.1 aminopeptidase P family protein [Gluconobacter potus]